MAESALNNDIYIGAISAPMYHYTNDEIVLNSAKGSFETDIIGNELSVDTFSFVVRYDPETMVAYSPIGKKGYKTSDNKLYLLSRPAAKFYLSEIKYGVECWWFVSGQRMAKGYVKTVDRITKYTWKITCVSGIGLLDERMHRGGIYTGQTFGSIYNSIVGTAFPSSVASAVKQTPVYGWLPYDTARKNLHRLLFAVGASLWQPAGTINNPSSLRYDYSIIFLDTKVINVPSSRIALAGSVQMQTPSNTAEVVEHGFAALPSDEVITLYDNTTGESGAANHTLIVFNDPMHDISAESGIVIHDSGVNFAEISGTGKLTGKKYTHNEQLITVTNGAAGDAKRTKRVTDNCLVSFANSYNVARRILAYYSTSKSVKSKIIVDSERCGRYLSMTDSFGDKTQAYLAKMDILVTTVKGATIEMVEGYQHEYYGNNFTHHVLLTSSGTWTVPEGVDLIRIVLIGGGQGGQGGTDGHWGAGAYPPTFGDSAVGELSYMDGEVSPSIPGYPGLKACMYYYEEGNQPTVPGGSAGKPGEQGKVLVSTVDVEPGQVLTISIGARGTGGARGANGGSGAMGATGGDTTVTSGSMALTSADGLQSEIGYYDAYDDKTYALPGVIGTDGGAGGMVNNTPSFNSLGINGLAGGKVLTWNGANGGFGKKLSYWINTNPKTYQMATGGGGGGAAYGNRPSAAGRNAVYTDSNQGQFLRYLTSGQGGDGADADAPADKTGHYGDAGDGGHGGGSGGNTGGVIWYYFDSEVPELDRPIRLGLAMDEETHQYLGPTGYHGGAPGKGSRGGHAGQGCAIIYW